MNDVLVGQHHYPDRSIPAIIGEPHTQGVSRPVNLTRQADGAWALDVSGVNPNTFPSPTRSFPDALKAARKWVNRMGGTCYKRPKGVTVDC